RCPALLSHLFPYTTLFRSRYTGQEDVLIGSPIAGRTSETENTIGPFASSICVRSDLSGNPTFRELLGRVRAVVVGALEHKELPLDRKSTRLNSSHGSISYA